MRVIMGGTEHYSINEYMKYRMSFKDMQVYVDGVKIDSCYGFDTDRGEAYVYVSDDNGHCLRGKREVRKAVIHGFVTVEKLTKNDDDNAIDKAMEELTRTLLNKKMDVSITVVQRFEDPVSKKELDESADNIMKILENHMI